MNSYDIKKVRNFMYSNLKMACIFIFSTAWGNQPYSLGSYTSIAVGGQPHDIEKIADPLYLKPNKRSVSNVLIDKRPTFQSCLLIAL